MQGSLPAQDWQIDFTHMPPVRRVRYLLVLVDTFLGWGEAFPTTNKRAHTVAQIFLTEIIPRFGLPSSLQSDNGPEFTSKVTQQLVPFLQIPWKFHIPYHPQASGKVDRMTRIKKPSPNQPLKDIWVGPNFCQLFSEYRLCPESPWG